MILKESTKKFKNPITKNKDKHHPGSTIANLIQKPVLQGPAMKGTSYVDPVSLNNSCVGKEELWFVELVPASLNNSCGLKRRAVICGTCKGKQYTKKPCCNRYL